MTVTDPVCSQDVDTETADATSEYHGHTYYFCCPECKAEFEQDPARYISASPGGDATARPDLPDVPL